MIRPSLRRGRGQAAPRSCKDDDTGLDYYDTLAGDIWHPRRAGQQARGDALGALQHHGIAGHAMMLRVRCPDQRS
jgi:hypothetical protein